MNINNEIISTKRGFLNNDFEFFHIKDRKNMQFEFHYHDFNKIIVFLSGKVTYLIEGKAYRLKPWDILLVSSNEVHKPMIDPDETYERIVLWLNSSFLEKHSSPESYLLNCFHISTEKHCNVLRPTPEQLINLRHVLTQLEEAIKSDGFGSRILKNSLFIQFIVYINQFVLQSESSLDKLTDMEYDGQIDAVLSHINGNLSEELTIESLAAKFFINKYYLMHKFKAQTGYSIHNYILQKRLIMGNSLIKKGRQISQAALECGFNDYSSFVRAFTKMFGLSPKKYYKTLLEQQNQLHD